MKAALLLILTLALCLFTFAFIYFARTGSRAAAARALPRRAEPHLKPFLNFNAVTLGAKLAVIFAALGLAPLLALSAINYRSGVGAVEGLLRERASQRASPGG